MKKVFIFLILFQFIFSAQGFTQPQRMQAIEKSLMDYDMPVTSPEKVTVNFSNAPLLDVLRSLSEDTHINIIAGKDVAGTVTVHLVDVPLEEALDSILLSNGYTYVRENDILRVLSTSEADKEETTKMETQVFTLKYANADDLKPSLEKLISKDGLIQVLARTSAKNNKSRPNTIIIRDKPEIVTSIAKVIASLDKEPHQVLIEAKFLNVQLDNTDKRGIDWTIIAALQGSKAPTTFPLPNKKSSWDPKNGMTPSHSPTATDFAANALFPYAVKGDFTFGSLDFTQTQAVLRMIETKTKVKLISAPRLAVMDGEEALINIGENYPIPLYEHSKDTGLLYVSGYQETKIGIILRVTPYYQEDGDKIMLDLHPEVSEITGYVGPNNERPITSTKEVDTTVTIANGNTIIIGGLMKEETTYNNNQVPFLGNVPFIGSLFRYKGKVVSKTELLIFLSPHIIDKEPGMDLNLNKDKED